MKDVLRRLFRLRSGEARIVFILGLILLSNAVAQQVTGIVGVSGFLSEGGVDQILLVWVVDAALMILTTGLQSMIIDRFDRITLMRWVSFGFAMVFVLLRLMFTFRVPGWLNYSLIYLVSQQQWLFFPLVFWVLANDVLDIAQTKRLFPVVASFGLAGRLLGIGIAFVSPSLLARLAIPPEEILVLSVLIYMLAFLLVTAGLRRVHVRRTQQKHETVRETLSEGWDFVRGVPLFRYLTIAILVLVVSDTLIEFRFLTISDQAFTDMAAYQRFYSLYRLGLYVAAFLLQSIFTNRIIARIGQESAHLIAPISASVGVAWMMALPGLASSLGGVVLQKLPVITIDDSARRTLLALVPEERRGRVSAFLDSYLFSAGTLVGCGLAGLVLVVLGAVRAGERWLHYVLMALAAVATLTALWAVFRMRSVYASSLFNWRLKRRQRRASVLDDLDF